MTHHKMNKCSVKVVGRDSIHCFKVILGLFMQPLLVLLGTSFFHHQQTRQVCLLDLISIFILNLFLIIIFVLFLLYYSFHSQSCES
uniref:Uncharacterized protein n=1 Tax=Lotus japonicus TaxID=34305 RepID=I3SE81_LOTJA|nr:unknown [Lotus japonicus]